MSFWTAWIKEICSTSIEISTSNLTLNRTHLNGTLGNITQTNLTTLSSIPVHSMTCQTQVLSKAIGFVVLIIGTWLKVPQLMSALSQFSLSGLPVVPLVMETLGLLIVIAYNTHEKNPFTTWGESVSMMIADVLLLAIGYASIPSRSLRKRILVGLFGTIMVLFFRYLMFFAPLSTLNTFLVCTAPLFLGSSLWQLLINQRNRHIGSLSPSMLWCGFFCAWSRLFTTAVELDDPIILLSAMAGTFFSSALVVQMIAFRRGTRRYLQSLKKEL